MTAPPRPIRSHRDLQVWQVSMDLADRVYAATSRFPAHERFGLVSQMRRAAVSVPANISEGQGRDHLGDYIHHLSIAKGSVAELDTLVRLSVMRGYLTDEEAAELLKLIDQTGRMLGGLIRALKRKRQ